MAEGATRADGAVGAGSAVGVGPVGAASAPPIDTVRAPTTAIRSFTRRAGRSSRNHEMVVNINVITVATTTRPTSPQPFP